MSENKPLLCLRHWKVSQLLLPVQSELTDTILSLITPFLFLPPATNSSNASVPYSHLPNGPAHGFASGLTVDRFLTSRYISLVRWALDTVGCPPLLASPAGCKTMRCSRDSRKHCTSTFDEFPAESRLSEISSSELRSVQKGVNATPASSCQCSYLFKVDSELKRHAPWLYVEHYCRRPNFCPS